MVLQTRDSFPRVLERAPKPLVIFAQRCDLSWGPKMTLLQATKTEGPVVLLTSTS